MLFREFVLLALVISSPPLSLSTEFEPEFNSNSDCSSVGESDEFSHEKEVKYKSYLVNCSTLSLSVFNKGLQKKNTGFVIRIDGEVLNKTKLNLSPGETRNWTFNVTRGLNVVRDSHTVTVSTYGNYTQYKFTRDLNTSNPGPIPRPHITDVEVTNGTIDGEPSAVAKVTVSNPGIQLYSTKLMVFTEGTDGSFYGASVPAGENRTIPVELLDERGAKVAGEARLYTKNLSQREGAIDQVEFVGRAGENTTVWNKSYQPVTAPWRNDHYVYDNESIQTGGDENGLLPDLSPIQRLYAGVGILLLSLFGVKRVF